MNFKQSSLRWRTRGVIVLAAAVVASLALLVSGGGAATPSPIVVMVQAPLSSPVGTAYPGYEVIGKVYQAYINAKGGIAGHPLKVIFCNDQNDPNQTQTCAQQAVAAHVVACIACFSLNGARFVPVYEAAGTAMFGGCCASSAAEFSSKYDYPLGAGVAIGSGLVYKAGMLGCKRPVEMILGPIPSTGFGLQLAEAAISHTPAKKLAAEVTVPLQPGDYSAQIAQAQAANPDCIIGVLSESQWGAMLPQMQQLGVKARLFGIQGNLDDKTIPLAPSLTENAVIDGMYLPLSDPVWADMRGALKKYRAFKGIDYNSLNSLGAWVSFEAFRQVIENAHLKTINNQTFQQAASTATIKLPQIPKISFRGEFTGLPGFPRLFYRVLTYQVVKGGKVVELDNKYHDVTFTLKPASS